MGPLPALGQQVVRPTSVRRGRAGAASGGDRLGDESIGTASQLSPAPDWTLIFKLSGLRFGSTICQPTITSPRAPSVAVRSSRGGTVSTSTFNSARGGPSGLARPCLSTVRKL